MTPTTNDMETIRKLARKELGDEAELIEEIRHGDRTLSVWKAAHVLPPRRTAILDLPSGPIVVSHSIENFTTLLQAFGLKPDDVGEILALFAKAAPGRRRILGEESDLRSPVEGWHRPRVEGSLVFFCNNASSGMIERVVIGPDLRTSITDYAMGRHLPYR